jgi:hypothetical protein
VTEFDVKIDCSGKNSSLFRHAPCKKYVHSFRKSPPPSKRKARGAPKIEGFKQARSPYCSQYKSTTCFSVFPHCTTPLRCPYIQFWILYRVDQLVTEHLSSQGKLDPRGGLCCFFVYKQNLNPSS